MYNFKCLSYKYLRNKIAKNYYICTHLKKLEKNNKLKERKENGNQIEKGSDDHLSGS